MKNKKNMLLSIIAITTLLVLVVGATYAYFAAQTGAGAGADVNVTTSTTDNLTFNTEGEITIHATPENFGKDAANLSDSAKASATLRANNATNSATSNYDLYLDISANNFVYTTEAETAELILTITDPNGNKVTELTGYDYVTVNGVSGFDITTVSGQMKLASKYEITAEGIETHEWNLELTFINLDSDQEENTGKTFSAELLIEKGKGPNKGGALPGTLAHHIISQYGADPTLYYHDENLEGGAGDYSYRYSGKYKVTEAYKNVYEYSEDVVKFECDEDSINGEYFYHFGEYPEEQIRKTTYDNCDVRGDVYNENGDLIYTATIKNQRIWYLAYDEEHRYYEFSSSNSKYDLQSKAVSDGILEEINNYVCFGNDDQTCPQDNLYRIIGVFDGKVKLIKAEYAAANLLGLDGAHYDSGDEIFYHWNSDTKNNTWSESDLNTINLNTNYLNNIGDKWANMISLSRWSVGGIQEDFTKSAKDYYDLEMTFEAEYTAKVGLQYVSDGAYSQSKLGWADGICENSPSCAFDNWLSGPIEYSITRVVDATDKVFFGPYYTFDSSYTVFSEFFTETIIRPTFYLQESVEYKGGTGTMEDPIRIS